MNKSRYNREEKIQKAIKAATASKQSAIAFLIKAGILESNGSLAPHLR